MKTNVNLLPPDFLPPQKVLFIRRASYLALLLLIILLVFAAFYLYSYRDRLHGELSLRQEQKERLEAEVREAAEVLEEINYRRRQLEAQDYFRQKLLPWSDYLFHINEVSRGLLEFDLLHSTAEGEIIIEGRAPGLESIAVYSLRLEQSDYFTEVYYRSVEYQAEPGENPDSGADDYGREDTFYEYKVHARLAGFTH